MANKRSVSVTHTNVDIHCSTTKPNLARNDTAHHVMDVFNGRRGSIYELELCSVTLNNSLTFNGQSKAIKSYGIVGKSSAAPQTRFSLIPVVARAPATEEIQTIVTYYDSTQRVGNNQYLPPSESWPADYEMDVL